MIPKGNGPSHYSNMAALIKGFLAIYGHYNQHYHMIQNCNDGEELQHWYLNCKALSKSPEFPDVDIGVTMWQLLLSSTLCSPLSLLAHLAFIFIQETS